MRKDNKTFEDNLKRLHVLSGIKPINENRQGTSSTILDTLATSKGTYGIVKESGSYYIKISKSEVINESTLDYIGGIANRKEFKYPSYADALKHLNFIKLNLNESNELVVPIQEDEEEVEDDDVLQELLDKDIHGGGAPGQEAPMPQPAPEIQPQGAPAPAPAPAPMPEPMPEPAPEPQAAPAPEGQPAPEEGGDFGAAPEGGSEQIDHFVGKLTGELRNQGEALGSDKLKSILNSVVSAIDLQKIDPDTRFEIGKRIKDGKNSQEDEVEGGEGQGGDDVPAAPAPEPQGAPAPEEQPMAEEFDMKDDEKINEFFIKNKKNIVYENAKLKVNNVLVESTGNKVTLTKGDKSFNYMVSEKTVARINTLLEHKKDKVLTEQITEYFKNKK